MRYYIRILQIIYNSLHNINYGYIACIHICSTSSLFYNPLFCVFHVNNWSTASCCVEQQSKNSRIIKKASRDCSLESHEGHRGPLDRTPVAAAPPSIDRARDKRWGESRVYSRLQFNTDEKRESGVGFGAPITRGKTWRWLPGSTNEGQEQTVGFRAHEQRAGAGRWLQGSTIEGLEKSADFKTPLTRGRSRALASRPNCRGQKPGVSKCLQV